MQMVNFELITFILCKPVVIKSMFLYRRHRSLNFFSADAHHRCERSLTLSRARYCNFEIILDIRKLEVTSLYILFYVFARLSLFIKQ